MSNDNSAGILNTIAGKIVPKPRPNKNARPFYYDHRGQFNPNEPYRHGPDQKAHEAARARYNQQQAEIARKEQEEKDANFWNDWAKVQSGEKNDTWFNGVYGPNASYNARRIRNRDASSTTRTMLNPKVDSAAQKAAVQTIGAEFKDAFKDLAQVTKDRLFKPKEKESTSNEGLTKEERERNIRGAVTRLY